MRPKSTPSCVRHFGELSFLCGFFRMNRFKIHFRRSGCCVSWHSMLWPPHVLFGCGNVLLNEHIWLFSVSRHSYRVFEPQNTENSIALSFDIFFFSPHISLIFGHPTIWTIQKFLAHVFGARSVSIRYLLDRCTVKVNLFVHGSYRNYCSSDII